MPRPVKCRKVCHFPQILEFLPADDTEKKTPIVLTVDEYETIRLLDKKGYSQEQCAESMQIARTTVQRIYEIARKKIADALIDGHPLKIEGGDFIICDGQSSDCSFGGCYKQEFYQKYAVGKGEGIMKKRWFAASLAALMALSMTACGGGKAAETTAAGETEAAKDGEKKVLKVAMECAYAPYNWTQPDDSNGAVPINDSSDYAYGYDVMMAKKIADELGYDLEIVKLDWDSLVPAVQSGQVDCVIAGQSITKERQQMVDFTDPYYYASIITLVKEDGDYKDAASVEDLKGATVTSQQNTIWYDSCLPQIPDANILPAQESAPAMLVALESGKCDAVVTDMPTGKAACVAYPDFKLLDFSDTEGAFEVSDEDINIGISLKKGNDELKDAINGVLSEMTEDDYSKMMDEAISVQPLSE